MRLLAEVYGDTPQQMIDRLLNMAAESHPTVLTDNAKNGDDLVASYNIVPERNDRCGF